ncbi:MAG: hypothetical protein KIT43_09845 [Bauldia sp.]|nr:hypothetical protein [Bauldia sp.]
MTATDPFSQPLVGIGLYTPTEASRLVGVAAGKIVRWLRGHQIGDKPYPRLWRPQIDLGDNRVYLGFRDLMEVRVASIFITRIGLSPIKVRRAIEVAQAMTSDEHPLSTTWLKTDGRTVFLEVIQDDGSARLIDLFKSQYAFRDVIAPSFKDVDFDDVGIPQRWWPAGKSAGVLVDPKRSFGRPIEATSFVPVEVLASAAIAEGSEARAAKAWGVPSSSVARAVRFVTGIADRKAA